jgi:hypothetical protein
VAHQPLQMPRRCDQAFQVTLNRERDAVVAEAFDAANRRLRAA